LLKIIKGVSAFVNCRLVAGLLARSLYPEGPATGHLGTGLSWFPCVYKRMLRWFPTLQVATACFLCSPPDLNFLDLYFILMYMHYNHCHRATAHLQLHIFYYDCYKLPLIVSLTSDSFVGFGPHKMRKFLKIFIFNYF